MERCPICRSDVIEGRCSQKRKKDCPYIEVVEENEEAAD